MAVSGQRDLWFPNEQGFFYHVKQSLKINKPLCRVSENSYILLLSHFMEIYAYAFTEINEMRGPYLTNTHICRETFINTQLFSLWQDNVLDLHPGSRGLDLLLSLFASDRVTQE